MQVLLMKTYSKNVSEFREWRKRISQKLGEKCIWILIIVSVHDSFHSGPEAGPCLGQCGHSAESLHEFSAAHGDPAGLGERQ